MRTGHRLSILVAVVVAACSSGGGATSSPPASSAAPTAAPVELTIFAAASLGNALKAAETAYEAANPGVTLTISTDSSSALETQIEQGAPADLFLSADTTNPQKLVDGGFTTGEATVFAGNKLCVILPSGNTGGVITPVDLARSGLKVIAAGDEVPITKYATQLVANLARSGVKIIGAGDSVPITRYATQLVGNLAKQSGYPANFVTAYASNVVSKEDSVAGVVSKVALGEGDAGIVYVTDAKTSPRVKTIDVPADANVPATYGGVVVKASQHQDAASQFLTWLAGSDGQAILATFGFLPPG